MLDEVKTLSANGYKEVVLTGIHLSSYGIDCDDNLLSLILAIHEVEGIERIRLGSLERELLRKNLHRRSQNFQDVSAFPSVIAERMQRNIEAHEPQIHSRRVL